MRTGNIPRAILKNSFKTVFTSYIRLIYNNNMVIENMDHLARDFTQESEFLHHSQMGKKATKTKILFWVPTEDSSMPTHLVSIKVPKGLPVYRLRIFISSMEHELSSIYGPSKRANIVLIQDTEHGPWSALYQLPTYDIQYA